MATHYLIFFSLSFAFSVILTPLIRNFALKRGILDRPGERKVHTKPVARLGGVAVFLSFWLTIALILISAPDRLAFVSDKIVGIDRNFFGVILGSLVLLATGIWDDVKGVKPMVKLLLHILASLFVVFFGIKILWIHNPITGLDIVIGNLTYLLVPLWLVLVINVINWLDGVDGLATGVGSIASIVIFLLSITTAVNQPATALLAIVLAGSLIGFLVFNFNPASIFLGDTGSMFIGFMLGIFSIISGGKFATAALVLGLPILDAFWVILRRVLAGRSPWQADRRHLHHRFLDAGFSQRQAVLFLYTVSAFFGLIALASGTRQKLLAFFWLLGVMLFIGLILVIMEFNKRYGRKTTG